MCWQVSLQYLNVSTRQQEAGWCPSTFINFVKITGGLGLSNILMLHICSF